MRKTTMLLDEVIASYLQLKDTLPFRRRLDILGAIAEHVGFKVHLIHRSYCVTSATGDGRYRHIPRNTFAYRLSMNGLTRIVGEGGEIGANKIALSIENQARIHLDNASATFQWQDATWAGGHSPMIDSEHQEMAIGHFESARQAKTLAASTRTAHSTQRRRSL